MDKGKMGTVTIGVTVIILLTVFLFILYASFNQDRPQIVLPEESGYSDVTSPGSAENGTDSVTRVEVTTETVQNVIATLNRPEAYLRTITITTCWSGGEGTVTVNSYVSGESVRMDTVLAGGQVRHTIRTAEKTYLWYNSERSVSVVNTGDFSADAEQWIPTYEDLLDMDRTRIAEAGYESYLELDCIYAVTAEDSHGYSERYWVSVDNGLLIAAERLQNGQTVYRMEGSNVTVGEPDAALFTLPDGTLLSGNAA